jgi:hypothetical protein
LRLNQGEDHDVLAEAHYKIGSVTVFNNKIADHRVKGMFTHEVAHLIPPETRKSFEVAFNKDKKDVTLYGTKSNKEEAFAEAYSKYFISGKVTGIGGKSPLSNVNSWMKSNYGDTNGKESNNSDLLYLAEDDDEIKIEPVYKGKEFVGEIISVSKIKHSKIQEFKWITIPSITSSSNNKVKEVFISKVIKK